MTDSVGGSELEIKYFLNHITCWQINIACWVNIVQYFLGWYGSASRR